MHSAGLQKHSDDGMRERHMCCDTLFVFCSCQDDPMDRGAWQATVYGVAKSWTQLSGRAHKHRHTRLVRIPLLTPSPFHLWCITHPLSLPAPQQ